MLSFVYFDLGGVLELDFSKTNKFELLKKELSISNEQNQEFELFWEKYEGEVCTGRDIETLIPLIEEKFGSKFPSGYSLLIDGFVSKFEHNEYIWSVISEIRKTAKIGILTNAYPGMVKAIKDSKIIDEIDWDVIVDSSVVGAKKPDPRIYKIAEKQAGFAGSEILFVENSPMHTEAANKFGWQTFLYDPSKPEEASKDLLTFFTTLL